MARRIFWEEPELNTVTKVEISKSDTYYGTYEVVALIDATSDGNPKSASNTWVTSYTDVTGTRTQWYRIRFYDGVNLVYSDYSDPVTSEELIQLCTVEDVKEVIDTTGRFTDDEIFKTIKEVDDYIYIEAGTPIQSSWSYIGKVDNVLQNTYYVGEENIYRVDNVFYGTVSKSECFLDDEYKVNLKRGMIRFLPVASGGPVLDESATVEIHYVPQIYHKLSLYMTIVRLLEKIDFTSDGRPSKELIVAKQRLEQLESILKNRVSLALSSNYDSYDPIYGVNRKQVIQDHVRNNYISSSSWY